MSKNPLEGAQETIGNVAGNVASGVSGFVGGLKERFTGEDDHNDQPAPEAKPAAEAKDTQEPKDAPKAEEAPKSAEAAKAEDTPEAQQVSGQGASGQAPAASAAPEDPELGSDAMPAQPHHGGSAGGSDPAAGSLAQEHSTSRDIDGDGSIDVVHSTPATGPQIDYLNADGEVVLTDVDSDFNGTFETSITQSADNVVVRSVDVDDDGNMDQVTYADGSTGVVFAQENLVDGKVAETLVDEDGDGVTDIQLVDSDLDGKVEQVAVDTDADGVANVVLHDVNGDGVFEYAAVDTDNDGVMDTNVDATEFGSDEIDEVADFDPFTAPDTGHAADSSVEF